MRSLTTADPIEVTECDLFTSITVVALRPSGSQTDETVPRRAIRLYTWSPGRPDGRITYPECTPAVSQCPTIICSILCRGYIDAQLASRPPREHARRLAVISVSRLNLVHIIQGGCAREGYLVTRITVTLSIFNFST